jgi:hypothetical protein
MDYLVHFNDWVGLYLWYGLIGITGIVTFLHWTLKLQVRVAVILLSHTLFDIDSRIATRKRVTLDEETPVSDQKRNVFRAHNPSVLLQLRLPAYPVYQQG